MKILSVLNNINKVTYNINKTFVDNFKFVKNNYVKINDENGLVSIKANPFFLLI